MSGAGTISLGNTGTNTKALGAVLRQLQQYPLALKNPLLLGVWRAAQLDWWAIELAIFGTLFECGLDPDKRSQLGGHCTDAESICCLIEPTIRVRLLAEWTAVKAGIAARLGKAPKPASRPPIGCVSFWNGCGHSGRWNTACH